MCMCVRVYAFSEGKKRAYVFPFVCMFHRLEYSVTKTECMSKSTVFFLKMFRNEKVAHIIIQIRSLMFINNS